MADYRYKLIIQLSQELKLKFMRWGLNLYDYYSVIN